MAPLSGPCDGSASGGGGGGRGAGADANCTPTGGAAQGATVHVAAGTLKVKISSRICIIRLEEVDKGERVIG